MRHDQTRPDSRTRKLAWIALLLIILLSFAMVFIPAWVIHPFKPQTTTGLDLSYMLRRWSPIWTLISLALALLLVVWLWRRPRTTRLRTLLRRTVLALALVPLIATAWLARQNHFEWMFKPLTGPATHAPATAADFVAADEMIMAIELNGDAVAYPIKQIAYHHVIEDTVGGRPVVATY